MKNKWLNNKYEKQINYIIDNFDWNRVSVVMNALNWWWATSNGSKIPNTDDMKRCAIDKLERAAMYYEEDNSKRASYVSSGGFEARCTEGFLELKFVVEEKDSFYML